MRQLFLITTSSLLLLSCHKEMNRPVHGPGPLEEIRRLLRDSFNNADHSDPKFSKVYLSGIDDKNIRLVKVNSFNAIPDAGSTCTITIFTDIPVNSDPSTLFDLSTASPGHSFLRLQKCNGTQSVSRTIGFYPKTRWKAAMTTAPIAGKFVDDQNHEYNASCQVSISPAQLKLGLVKMVYLARFVRYDIDDYNCTDWALNIFNEVVSPADYIDIRRYDIPGGMAPNGTSTPSGIYIRLQEMKRAGGSVAARISVPVIGWA